MSLILDSSGRPMGDAAPANRRTSASLTGSNAGRFAYDSAEFQTQEMGDWHPVIRSPDSEINPYRDRLVSRSRDLVRNDGWAAGGITRILDNTVGAAMRLSAAPDYRALAAMTGIKGFDAKWAEEFRRTAESLWRGFADDIGRYNDVSRQLTVSQQMRLALRHKLVDGDSLIVNYWMPERIGRGAARYATAYLLTDPDRLSNPLQAMDTKYLRGGVEIDDYGVPIAYHVRKAEQNDWYNTVDAMMWERIEREDEDGWFRVIHDFERDRAGQHRGVGVFNAVLARFKMLARYYGVELQAATIAATFGTYVTSPFDRDLVQDALDGGELNAYQELRADYHKDRPAMLNGARVPLLAPGEKIESVGAEHPHAGFSAFAQEMLRGFAAATGMSAEQISQDWSRTNYSSARAALLESWKTLTRRNTEFKIGTATPMYATWLHEVMDLGLLPLPAGAPDYIECRTAYSKCDWLGTARGWVDPVKEKQGSILGMDAGLSTLQRECAEQGLDYEEVIDQRAREADLFKEKGLPPPNWYGNDATSAAQTQEEEQAR